MRETVSGVFSLGVVVLAVAGLARVALAAAPAQRIDGEAALGAPREVELEAIRAQMRELRGELGEVGRVGASVDNELRRLDLELSLQRQLVAEATAERSLAEESLRSTIDRVERVEAALAATRNRLEDRLRSLHKAAPADWLRGFVSVRDPVDLFLYARTLRLLARRDSRLLPAYMEQRAQLAAERDDLARRENEVRRSVARQRARLTELAAARRRQELVAKALEKERLRIEREAATLDDKERKLALLISVLADPDEAVLAGSPIQDFKGALDWPLAGSLAVPFGRRYESRYGTSVPHNGIQIEPSGNGEVRAVFPGVVIFAAPFEGFGLTVVLHHSRKVFSLHAGLDELSVSKNDVVALAALLGRTRAPLYFEIRVENKPEDPMEWLR